MPCECQCNDHRTTIEIESGSLTVILSRRTYGASVFEGTTPAWELFENAFDEKKFPQPTRSTTAHNGNTAESLVIVLGCVPPRMDRRRRRNDDLYLRNQFGNFLFIRLAPLRSTAAME